jgi:hypothetical protein
MALVVKAYTSKTLKMRISLVILLVCGIAAFLI